MQTQSIQDSSDSTTVINVRKQPEFEAFLKIIEKGKIEHWFVVAEALGVREATISEWKKHPLARKAIAKGIMQCLEKMEEAGKHDWRMWREKLKILGVRDKQNEMEPMSPIFFNKEEYFD